MLDVGCADGAITIELAKRFVKIKFLGIDLNSIFLKNASKKAEDLQLKNVMFDNIDLHALLDRRDKFDAVCFISVLHEFYSYGEGIYSVSKALTDAHELLRLGGDIIVRDMVLEKYTKDSEFLVRGVMKKIRAQKEILERLNDFEKVFEKISNIYSLNHFLLKYRYEENWPRELHENYVPITFDDYENIFRLLGMEIIFEDSYLLPFLKEKWRADFKLTDEEISAFRSTGLLVARKGEKTK